MVYHGSCKSFLAADRENILANIGEILKFSVNERSLVKNFMAKVICLNVRPVFKKKGGGVHNYGNHCGGMQLPQKISVLEFNPFQPALILMTFENIVKLLMMKLPGIELLKGCRNGLS